MIHQREFIRKKLIEQVNDLISSGFCLIAFVTMAQSIEVLGAFLDKKPFKAPFQSKKRFALAVDNLFPKEYQKLNKNDFLYKHLRSNLVHLMMESSFLNLTSNTISKEGHLSYRNKRTTLLVENTFEDFKMACHRVIQDLEEHRLKHKILA